MSTNREELRSELTAVMNARRELSSDHDEYLAELFLTRLERDFNARMAAQAVPRAQRNAVGCFKLMSDVAVLAIPVPVAFIVTFMVWEQPWSTAFLALWVVFTAFLVTTISVTWRIAERKLTRTK